MLTSQIGLKSNLHAQCKPTLSSGSLGQVTCANSSCRYVTVDAASLQQINIHGNTCAEWRGKEQKSCGRLCSVPSSTFWTCRISTGWTWSHASKAMQPKQPTCAQTATASRMTLQRPGKPHHLFLTLSAGHSVKTCCGGVYWGGGECVWMCVRGKDGSPPVTELPVFSPRRQVFHAAWDITYRYSQRKTHCI